VQGFGNLHVVNGTHEAVRRALLHEEAPVEEHAHGLHGEQRHPLRPRHERRSDLRREPWDQAVEQRRHGPGRKRLQVHPRRVTPSPPPQPVIEEFGAGQSQDEDRVGARPLQQVVDELQERSFGPLAVLKGHDHRAVLGHPLEEQAPPGEQVLLLPDRSFLQAQEVRQAGLHPPPFLGIRYVARDRRAQLRSGRREVFSLHDVRPASDHLRQRPVRHAVPVRQTSPPMPPV
jgi:hypothetical protein